MASWYKKIDSYILNEMQSEGTEFGERLKDIQITYLSNGEFFASSPKYNRVPEEKVDKIRVNLDNLIQENVNTPESQPIIFTFFDMTREVDEIVFQRK